MIFSSYNGVLLKYLLPDVLIIGVFSALVVVVFNEIYPIAWVLKTGVHSLLGIVLGLFLVFRTNSAYDRWWEGRKLWGQLVNHSRSLAMKLDSALKPEDESNRKFFAVIISDFARVLQLHLKGKTDSIEITRGIYQESAFEGTPHIPNRIATLLHSRIGTLSNKGLLKPVEFRGLARELEGLVDVLGSCERIKNTPIPIAYSMFIKKFIFIYLVTMPFGFKEEFGFWTIPAVMFISYVLLGIELIAEEVEEPFGSDENDLPTSILAETIRSNVHEILKIRPDQA